MPQQFIRHDPHDFTLQGWEGSGPLRVELEILRGMARQRVRLVRVPTFLIGAADDCDLVLGDGQFPEVHTYLRVASGVTLAHLGFAPTVTVNGRPVTKTPLSD